MEYLYRTTSSGNMKLIFVLVLCILPAAVFARGSVSVYVGENGGEHIFETGTKYPNLSGITGGSRLTFKRNFPAIGVELAQSWKKWNARFGYRGTLGYVDSGGGRDEDFFLYSISSENASKISLRESTLRDSAYVYTGTRNFADAKSGLAMREDAVDMTGEYYFKGSPDLWQNEGYFFLSGGLRYSYAKYIFTDIKQFVATSPVTVFYMQRGLTYSQVVWDHVAGFGVGKRQGGWFYHFGLEAMYVYSTVRDYHRWRDMNFFTEAAGFGINARLALGKAFGDYALTLQLTEHRYFLRGIIKTRGGLTLRDRMSNYAGGYRSYLNTKDHFVELRLSRRI